ncbi:replicative DNA helicase loader DnaB [Thermoactinomyces sp. DSM 45891]|uniref:DnaD domain protein n=1 Tax=Thermoactinomyces sp. DSM 45891 TaxID=1761907 RepID=UPI00090FAAFA|nr:DnaD domain protein [Thermoactinomyces sp. DSM 45891]SFX59178.1 replicative DNA helicase loader DnaB [Thermoactinomyces sp. DSM 45891]
MAFLWKELGWYCRSHRPLAPTDLIVLTQLYQPLIGATAYSLYLTLSYQLPTERAGMTEVHTHAMLMKMLGTPYDSFLEARHRLEGVGLLNTYELGNPQNGLIYEYEMISPLSPVQFFQSEVFNLALYQSVGKEIYPELRKRLLGPVPSENWRKQVKRNVTKPFKEVYGSFSPHDLQQMGEIDQEFPAPEHPIREDLQQGQIPMWSDEDLTSIKARLQSIIHSSTWTPECIAQLKEICFLYQLETWDLVAVLQDPYITQRGEINLERLRNYVRGEYQLRFGGLPQVQYHQKQLQGDISFKQAQLVRERQEVITPASDASPEEKHFHLLATVSPVELLHRYQGGGPVSDSDLKIVEKLVQKYDLSPQVVNVLIDYVMIKYNRKLTWSLIDKIAAHWVRAQVKTMEQAIEIAKSEQWESEGSVGTVTRSTKSKRSKSILPKAVAQQLEREKNNEAASMLSEEELEQNKIRLQAKLRLMNEKLADRGREKEQMP